MSLQIFGGRAELKQPVVPGPGITPRTATVDIKFPNELLNNRWLIALNGFSLRYTSGNDLRVLKHQVNVVRGVLKPADRSNRTLEVEVAFLLADDAGEAPFIGWADVVAIAEAA